VAKLSPGGMGLRPNPAVQMPWPRVDETHD
jgi:hypothetical protein